VAIVRLVLNGLIGFVVTSVLAVFALSVYLKPEEDHDGVRRHLPHFVIITGEVVAFCLIFSYLLEVPLPRGILT
jgi:hypothetical protein